MVIRRNYLRILTVALIAAAFVLIAVPLTQEEAHAKVSKSVAKKAKTYKKARNKLFKVGKAWYCFSRKKVRTGLQKVGKEYYFFNKSNGRMLTKSGLKKVGSAYYYFNKKSGKAPALRNASREIDGEIWFFQSDGKRYAYCYEDTGSTAGNDAAGIIISEAKIKPDGLGGEAELREAYSAIVSRSSYRITLEPDFSSNKWIGKFAEDCAENKGGKCYGFAALTYVTFKALGEHPVINTGEFSRSPGGEKGDHAWVVAENQNGDDVIYDTNQDNLISKDPASLTFFAKTITYQNEGKTSFTVQGSDYVFYPKAAVK